MGGSDSVWCWFEAVNERSGKCLLCEVRVPTDRFTEHATGTRHTTKEFRAALPSALQSERSNRPENDDSATELDSSHEKWCQPHNDWQHKCTLCDVLVPQAIFEAHVHGKRHRAKLATAQARDLGWNPKMDACDEVRDDVRENVRDVRDDVHDDVHDDCGEKSRAAESQWHELHNNWQSRCTLCDVLVPQATFEAHVHGKRHLAKLATAQAKALDWNPKRDTRNDVRDDVCDDVRDDVCDDVIDQEKSKTAESQWYEPHNHWQGRCTLCDVLVPTCAFTTHVIGGRHVAKLARSKKVKGLLAKVR